MFRTVSTGHQSNPLMTPVSMPKGGDRPDCILGFIQCQSAAQMCDERTSCIMLFCGAAPISVWPIDYETGAERAACSSPRITWPLVSQAARTVTRAGIVLSSSSTPVRPSCARLAVAYSRSISFRESLPTFKSEQILGGFSPPMFQATMLAKGSLVVCAV